MGLPACGANERKALSTTLFKEPDRQPGRSSKDREILLTCMWEKGELFSK